jgi:phytoene dehydrogenase-like protein
MTDRVVIIGGGHNGLVCAAYLARAGRKVTVLEAADQVGGAAVTREFSPGFKVSACAHILYGLDPMVATELALASHGLTLARSNLKTVALSPSGSPLLVDGSQTTHGEISAPDREAFGSFVERMRKFASLLARQHRRPPPRLAWETWSEAARAATLAWDIRRLGRDDMRDFMRIATMNIFDILEETFDSPLLKGALAMDAVLGTKLGPRSGHTVLNLLHRWSGSAGSEMSSGAIPRGGMGSVTRALVSAASAAGAQVRLSSPVASIVLEGDRAVGVRLASGEQVPADVVVSNADPKQTFLELLGARHLETEFARRVNTYRTQGTAAKLHLALASLPTFTNVDPSLLGERLLIAPDLDYIERAFNPVKYGECGTEPVLEITIPSIHDDTLAPKGQHVLSATVQYVPFDVDSSFIERALAVLEQYAPGLRTLITHAELLTPADIQREFRITGGHWHHGELVLDQFLMLRPVPGAAQYATPVRDLYLCGAGCHPGGGVMGSAGYNAAQAVLNGARTP